MELSARQFAHMVRHLKGPGRFGGSADQRRAPRVERQGRITIVPVDEGQPRAPVAVEVKNVSSRGIGFVNVRAMRAGSQFLVRMPREGGEEVELLCRVAHCERVGKGLYSIGAEFTWVTGEASAAEGDVGVREWIRSSLLG